MKLRQSSQWVFIDQNSKKYDAKRNKQETEECMCEKLMCEAAHKTSPVSECECRKAAETQHVGKMSKLWMQKGTNGTCGEVGVNGACRLC